MTPLVVGCIALLAVVSALAVLLVCIALYKDHKATGLLLVGRITSAINRAGTAGEITQSPAIFGVDLAQVTLNSPDLTVECTWPLSWPSPGGEHDLTLVRMFIGHLGAAPWMGFRTLSFAISHGLGANAGRTPEHMLIYTITGHTAHGKEVSYAGTLTARVHELDTYIRALSEAIAAMEARIKTPNPA